MVDKPTCHKCGVELDEDNWYPSLMATNTHTCKTCRNATTDGWRKANPDKYHRYIEKNQRKRGQLPMSKNKRCGAFLGVYIAERVLRHVFKNVKQMPYGNKGFDFICNRGKKIDVKSSCLHKDGRWDFSIAHNQIADYFLCIALDDRESLTPLYLWLLPSSVVGHAAVISIRPSTIHKWDEYKLSIDKVSMCCNVLRGEKS